MIRKRGSSSTGIRYPARKRQKTASSVLIVEGFVVTLMGLPISIRVKILNYFDEKKQQELRTLLVISKQFNATCKQPGIELNPLRHNGGNTFNFLQTMTQYQRNADTNNKLQRYCRIRVHGINKFNNFLHGAHLELITNNIIRMYGVETLDITIPLSSQTVVYMTNSLPLAIFRICPNLRAVDFSNVRMRGSLLRDCSRECHRLEKITWCHIHGCSHINVNGEGMESATNLREIIMDASFFYGRTDLGRMSDLNNHPHFFLFHRCCNQGLERLSIRNAIHAVYGQSKSSVSQNALIKFVRNVPSTLKWFRSDLTHDNLNMLRLERPDIELLN